MKNIFKLSALIAAAIIISAFALTVSAHDFTDVDEYDEAISTLTSIGVIRGKTATSYAPDDNVTRWQMALLITKLVTGNTDDPYWYTSDSTLEFDDVIADHYRGSIAYAHKNGIIIGRSDSEFAPDDGITTQDAATMLVRALGYPRSLYDAGYPDSYITEAHNLGLFDGLNDIVFTKTLTRGQTAQMLYNAFTAVKRGGGTFAVDAFDYRDLRLVLCSTRTLRLNQNIGLAPEGKLVFCALNQNGTLDSTAYTLDPAIFGLNTKTESELNLMLGKSWSIVAMDSFKNIVSLSESASATFTDGVSVASEGSSAVTIDKTVYKPVQSYSYLLNDGVIPSQRNIIIYGFGEMFSLSEPLSAEDIYASCAYYSITAYDDNGDGYYDRALYKPYGFGHYKNENGTITITGLGVHTLKEANITLVGGTLPSAETYMLFSYMPASGDFDFMKALPTQSGRISKYDVNSVSVYTLTADDAKTYPLGNASMFGSHNSDVAARIIETANNSKIDFKKCAVKYVLENGKVLKLIITENDKATVNVVKGSGYVSSKNCCVVQSVTTEYISYGLVGLTVIGSDGTTNFIYALNYNGNKLNKELAEAIKPGDILEYAKRSDKYTLEGIGGVLTIYDVTQISDKPHATLGNSTAYQYFIGYDSEYLGLGYKINVNGSIQYIAQVQTDKNTKVVIYDGLSITNITDSVIKDGYEQQIKGEYSMYVSNGSDGIADYVFFREAYKAVEVTVKTDYSTLVYLSKTAIGYGNYETESGTITYKNIVDLLSGKRIDVYYGELILEAGYYRAAKDSMGDYKLVSNKKVDENLANSYIDFKKGQTITAVKVVTGTSPVYEVTIKESDTVSRVYYVNSFTIYGPNSDGSDAQVYDSTDIMAFISRVSEIDYCIADVFMKPASSDGKTESMTIIITLF